MLDTLSSTTHSRKAFYASHPCPCPAAVAVAFVDQWQWLPQCFWAVAIISQRFLPLPSSCVLCIPSNKVTRVLSTLHQLGNFDFYLTSINFVQGQLFLLVCFLFCLRLLFVISVLGITLCTGGITCFWAKNLVLANTNPLTVKWISQFMSFEFNFVTFFPNLWRFDFFAFVPLPSPFLCLGLSLPLPLSLNLSLAVVTIVDFANLLVVWQCLRSVLNTSAI